MKKFQIISKNKKNLKKSHFFKKSESFEKKKKFQQKKSSLFLNIRNTRFNQISPVQPNPEKKIEKSQKIIFFNKSEKFKIFFICQTINAIFLVLPIEEISLWPELSSPANFRIQGRSPERDIRRSSSINSSRSSSRTLLLLPNIECMKGLCVILA